MFNKKLGLVFVFAASVFLVINNNGVEASHNIYSRLQNAAAVEVNQLHRTGYHFQPPKHWINDPNAPMYFNGIYDLFYQYNPKGAAWGNIVRAHSVSKTAWWHNGHWRILVGGKRKHRGMAWLYRSIDFKYWVKAKHPLHSAPETGMWECPDFFALALNGRSGVDTSKVGEDVKHILKVSLDETRYEYYTLGKYFPEKDRYVPDNTSVDGRAGLRLDYGNFYASKTFFDPSKNMRILWGWANESDAADDDKAKGWAGVQTIPRVVWLSSDAKQVVQWPIKELETLRGQKVDINNQNVEQGQHVEVKGITAAQADVEVTFSFGSLEKAEEFDPNWANLDAQTVCSLRRSDVPGGVGPFGLLTLASQNLEEFTPIFFRVFKTKETKHKVLMCSDAKSSSLRPFNEKLYRPSFAGFVDVDLSADKKISLRSLIDHSVVESFGAGGKTCITSRVYPTLAVNDAAHLFVFNNGTKPVTVQTLSAWSMNAPQQMNQNLEF
ncbi:beta-fructofuranosidase, insoluble isoenzyme 1 [Prunus persica]|uniref:beta-fructofuranosidase, insoluble isoenzyme 1 n=1 Tax=Prunus persica TaxID=3760 RepID=UPI0009AB964A|nr:beta-fructofuranosidase, insoluble isoenzyme 1 [Prunus persica]